MTTVFSRKLPDEHMANCLHCDWSTEDESSASVRKQIAAHVVGTDHIVIHRETRSRLFKRQPDDALEVDFVREGVI